MNPELMKLIFMTLCANYDPETTDLATQKECILSEIQARTDFEKFHNLLTNKTLKVTTLINPPLSGYTMVDGKMVGTGHVFDLFHEIQSFHNFQYELVLPKENILGDDNKGIISILQKREADIAVAFLPALPSLRRTILFSVELAEIDYILLMKRPSASASVAGLLAPFQVEVWLLILLSLILIGPVIYCIIYIRDKLTAGTYNESTLFPLPSCVWFVYGALLKQGSTLSPESDSTRILFATWWIFITILTSFYTANLTAFLTLSRFTLAIQGPKEVYSYWKNWLSDDGGTIQYIINYQEELDLLKQMIPRGKGKYTESKGYDLLRQIEDENKIYIGDKREATMMILRNYINRTEQDLEEKKRCTFVITPEPFLRQPVAWAYPYDETNPDNSDDMKYKYAFDHYLNFFVQSGIIDHLLTEELPLTTICPLNLPSTERKLKNDDLFLTYMVVISGFVSAFITFLVEIGYKLHNSKKKWNQLSINSGDMKRGKKNDSFFKQVTLLNGFTKQEKQNNFENKILHSNYYSHGFDNNAPQNEYNNYAQDWLGTQYGGTRIVPVRSSSGVLFHYMN